MLYAVSSWICQKLLTPIAHNLLKAKLDAYGFNRNLVRYIYSAVDTGHKLNVHKKFNLRPLSTGSYLEI